MSDPKDADPQEAYRFREDVTAASLSAHRWAAD
jgi:hypothetical protein